MRELSFEKKKQLVDALQQCPMMTNNDTRDSVVDQLEKDIRDSIKRHKRTDADIMNIVGACLNYSNGIEELIRIAGFYEGRSTPMREVHELIPVIWDFTPVMSHAVLGRLVAILFTESISQDELHRF